MNINTETIATMTEANQNFSKVAKVAEANGQAVIFKNNKPKFLLIDVDSNSYFDITDDENNSSSSKVFVERLDLIENPCALNLCIVNIIGVTHSGIQCVIKVGNKTERIYEYKC